MKTKDFLKIVDEHNEGQSYGLLPQPFPADRCLDILIEHFLGKDWFVTEPMCSEQVYTEAMCDILDKTQNQKKIEDKMKDLKYYKKNAEEDYFRVPISVLRYISKLLKWRIK